MPQGTECYDKKNHTRTNTETYGNKHTPNWKKKKPLASEMSIVNKFSTDFLPLIFFRSIISHISMSYHKRHFKLTRSILNVLITRFGKLWWIIAEEFPWKWSFHKKSVKHWTRKSHMISNGFMMMVSVRIRALAIF